MFRLVSFPDPNNLSADCFQYIVYHEATCAVSYLVLVDYFEIVLLIMISLYRLQAWTYLAELKRGRRFAVIHSKQSMFSVYLHSTFLYHLHSW